MASADESQGSSDELSSAPKEEPLLQLKKWCAVAFWKWENIPVGEQCDICRGPLLDPCLDCEDSSRKPCNLIKGMCDHVYHYHCVGPSLDLDYRCPYDRQPWETRQWYFCA